MANETKHPYGKAQQGEEFAKRKKLESEVYDLIKNTLVDTTEKAFKDVGIDDRKKYAGEYSDGTIYGTGVGKNELSAKKVFSSVYNEYKVEGKKITGQGILLAILSIIILGIIFLITAQMYFVNNLVILFLLPFLLIPFAADWNEKRVDLSIKNYLKQLRAYPKLWIFVLINILYYFFLKVICTGYLLTVATDPILHPVRLILVIYWLAIILPVPYLILKVGLSPFKAILVSYKAGSETRWQHFYLIIFILLMNAVAIIPIGIGLIFTLPLSYKIIHQYSKNMAEFKLFDL